MNGRSMLGLGALANVIIALVHLWAISAGPEAYVLLQAPDLGDLERTGSHYPDFVTGILTLFFLLFALYAYQGWRGVSSLPYPRFVLLAVGAVYFIRGLGFLPQIYLLVVEGMPLRFLLYSLVAFLIGLLYLVGGRRVYQ